MLSKPALSISSMISGLVVCTVNCGFRVRRLATRISLTFSLISQVPLLIIYSSIKLVIRYGTEPFIGIRYYLSFSIVILELNEFRLKIILIY